MIQPRSISVSQICAMMLSHGSAVHGPTAARKPPGMRQHVANRDALLALGAERRNVFRHAIIERNLAALPDLGKGDDSDRLDRGHPKHDGLWGHRDAVARHAERKIGDGLAFERNVKLRADMEPALDARFD
jgi:hypothetical protein